MAHFETYPELPYRRLQSIGVLRMLIPAFIIVGFIALVAAFMVDADRAWRAYHFNWLYFASVAQGAVLLAAVVSITRAVWSQPIRRLALSFVAFLPIAWVLAIPIFFGARHIFPWAANPDTMQAGKEAYLNVPFMAIRILGGLALLYAIDFAFAYWSLRPDLGLVKDREAGLREHYDRFTKNWIGQEREEATSFRKLARLGPLVAVVFALVYTLVSYDFVMSLEPHWYSTMIGPYFFMGAFLGGIAWTVIVIVTHMLKARAADVIHPVHLHDIGKLMFGFCVFWAYLFYGQYIVIWYGLLPHEQAWIVHRFGMPFQPVMALVFGCLFVFPFFGLMGVAPKRRPQILVGFATVVAIGLWLERYILVYPSLYTGARDVPFGWQEIGVALFFLGLMLLAVTWFQQRFPIFQIWQPSSELELLGVPSYEEQV
ncbi:MAG TPA: hypothetical protein VF021_12510, partial [Longimicrobiales bacterium]